MRSAPPAVGPSHGPRREHFRGGSVGGAGGEAGSAPARRLRPALSRSPRPPARLCCRNITEMMTTVSLQIVGIVEPIIQHADWFFPGGAWRPRGRERASRAAAASL